MNPHLRQHDLSRGLEDHTLLQNRRPSRTNLTGLVLTLLRSVLRTYSVCVLVVRTHTKSTADGSNSVGCTNSPTHTFTPG